MSIVNPEPWRYGPFKVDGHSIYTPRTTISIEHVDLVDVRKPLLPTSIAAAITAGGLALRFGDVLTATEIGVMLGVAWTGLMVGICTARLRLQSFSIRDASILLPIWVARPMRTAIEEALGSRQQKSQPEPWRKSL